MAQWGLKAQGARPPFVPFQLEGDASGRPSVGPGLGPGPASRMSVASQDHRSVDSDSPIDPSCADALSCRPFLQASATSRRVPPLRLSAISAAGRPTGRSWALVKHYAWLHRM